MKYYLVPEEELKDLLADSLRLQALDCEGVDNWEGCGWAIGEFLDTVKEDYNVPDDIDFDFDFDDIVETDIKGYRLIESE